MSDAVRGSRRWLGVALISFVMHGAVPSAAVETRRPDGNFFFTAEFMRRAYAPCLAPNTVSGQGVAACDPPVTSSCAFRFASLGPDAQGFLVLRLDRTPLPQDEPCRSGPYVFRITRRTTFERIAPDSRCAGDQCTYPDEILSIPLVDAEIGETRIDYLPPTAPRASVELMGGTIIAPDGLPLASIGSTSLTSNFGTVFPECLDPGSSYLTCVAPPWAPGCDFHSGALQWKNGYFVHVDLQGLAGRSPLCTSGTYSVDAGVRMTLNHCNGPASPPCTLVDSTIAMPLVANGKDLEGNAGLVSGLGGLEFLRIAEVLSTRITDPTGTLLAATAQPLTNILFAPRLTIHKNELRLRATFVDFDLDPTEPGGVTVAVTSGGGLVYRVTIPPARWQLQPPVGERWDYRDAVGVLNGVRTARIKHLYKKKLPVGWDVRLVAKGLTLPTLDFPSANVTIDIAPAATFPDGRTFQGQAHRLCKIRSDKFTCR